MHSVAGHASQDDRGHITRVRPFYQPIRREGRPHIIRSTGLVDVKGAGLSHSRHVYIYVRQVTRDWFGIKI